MKKKALTFTEHLASLHNFKVGDRVISVVGGMRGVVTKLKAGKNCYHRVMWANGHHGKSAACNIRLDK